MSRARSLEELILRNVPSVHFELCEQLVLSLPVLERLEVGCCPHVSGPQRRALNDKLKMKNAPPSQAQAAPAPATAANNPPALVHSLSVAEEKEQKGSNTAAPRKPVTAAIAVAYDVFACPLRLPFALPCTGSSRLRPCVHARSTGQ